MIRHHLQAVFKSTKDSPPWARMVVCAMATTMPLVVGMITGNVAYAIYAALLGYLIGLNDHLGELKHRILVATLSFVVMVLSLWLGLSLHGHSSLFVALTVILSYGLGLMGGLGAEVERLLLFSVILILVAFFTPKVSVESLYPMAAYGFVAYVVILVSMFVTDRLKWASGVEFARLRPSLATALTRERLRHIYAFSFMVTALLALAFVHTFEIKRGYWTMITVILIFRPSRTEMIYRSVQRFAGTVIGVLLAQAFVMIAGREEIVLLGILLCSFSLPLALKRNYWLVSVLVSVLVILLLDIPSIGHLDPELPYIRFQATLYGCLLSLLGVLIYWGLRHFATDTRSPST